MFTPSSDVCVATLVMLPVQGRQSEVSSLLTSQLAALREHIIMKNVRAYPSTQHTSRPAPRPTATQTEAPPPRSATAPPIEPATVGSARNRRIMSEPTVISQGTIPEACSIRETPSSVTPPTVDSRDAAFLQMSIEKSDKLIKAALGTEEDGWISLGTKNNVHSMKQVPKSGAGTSANCVKGTSFVNAPPLFIMHFLKDPSYNSKLDDMLNEIRIKHVVSPSVQLVHMLYKPVWPTAARDFAVLNLCGRRDANTLVSAAVSVVDERIPDEKGHVRGHLEAGGYVVQSIAGDPKKSEVTYVAQVDLKGSLPSVVTNKIADSQPQCVATLRGLVEPLYAQLSQSPEELAQYQEKFPVALLEEVVESTPSQVHHTLLTDCTPSQVHSYTPPHALHSLSYFTYLPFHPQSPVEENEVDLNAADSVSETEVRGHQDTLLTNQPVENGVRLLQIPSVRVHQCVNTDQHDCTTLY